MAIKIDNIEIPQAWDEVSFKTYLALADTEIDNTTSVNNFDSTLKIVSIATSTNENDLKALKADKFLQMVNVLGFVNDAPEHSKSVSKWKFKSMDEITYDDFLLYEKLKINYPYTVVDIMSMMLKEKPDIDINDLPVTEVLAGFFMLKNRLMKSINCSLVCLALKRMKLQMMKKLKIA